LQVLAPLVAAGGAGGPSGPGPFVGPAAPPEGVLPLYVQLLVSSRLDSEALRVATSALGEERARTVVEQYRAALPPTLAALPVAPDDGAFRGQTRPKVRPDP
ncbi:MAG: hypothetical protein FJ104_08130, partial [Deltaproteobacteria bacterium]|nr:hypothetical protein [Deltaproteobacteria bacterium]